MTDRLRWGILGTGNIAHSFANQIPMSRTATLVAVGSRRAGSAERFAAEYGLDRHHDSYQGLLDDPEVDAVYISTPHPQHAEWAVKAAEAGKHVLCEKPLSLNHSWAMAMVEAARRHDVFLMEAYMYRHHPRTVRLAELVRDGAIGTLHQIQASFAFRTGATDPGHRLFDPALAGGGILDVGGYPVSLARLLAGAAHGKPFEDPAMVTGAGRLGPTGVDEWATATLGWSDGITAQVSTGVRLAVPNQARVYGSEGYLVVDEPWIPAANAVTEILLYRADADEQPRRITIEPAAQYALEADAVAEHLAARQAPQMSWADSLGNLAAMDAWRDAIGLTYPAERIDADVPPVTGRPPRRRDDHGMRYGALPGLDKPVSRLVMGVDNQRDLVHASVMFDDFVERGGTTFDTAYIYRGGESERLLGRWIANRGVRDDVVVIGKGAHTPHCDPESIPRQLAESLDRLGTDHVDLYLMHRDNEEVPVGEFVDVLDELWRAGRMTAFGGSNWSLARFAEANAYAAAHGKQGFGALSNHFGLARAYDVPWNGCRHVTDPESVAWLTEHQVPLFPWSSQARGFFARADPADRSDAELVRCYYAEENFARLARARRLGAELGVPATAIALAYVLHQPFPTFALYGPRTLAESRTSLECLSVRLEPDQVRWLAEG